MFADKVEITIQAGRGGNGKISFSKERYKGGPTGGDGGKGGDIVIKADHNLNTLVHYRSAKYIKAKDGEDGGFNRRHGKNGPDVILKVPPGTQVYDASSKIADLTNDSKIKILARGGLGGFGNAHFTSSTRQLPKVAELGEPGEYKTLTLELKLIADIGLVGLPNAGKSTLLASITNAKPEIADYPFTTVTPNLGVVYFGKDNLIIADIPGIIEGASRGKGLGDDFLRHIERTTIILHLIDVTSSNPCKDLQTIKQELKSYVIDLSTKPKLVVLTKIDMINSKILKKIIINIQKATQFKKIYPISAITHQGLNELLHAANQEVKRTRLKLKKSIKKSKKIPIINIASRADLWKVAKNKEVYIISGGNIERFAVKTDLNKREGVERFTDILTKLGIYKELTKLGYKSGDIIRVADKQFKL